MLDLTRTRSKAHFSGENKNTKNIKIMIEKLGLSEINRYLNPTKQDFTFFSQYLSINFHFFIFNKVSSLLVVQCLFTSTQVLGQTNAETEKVTK